MSQEKVMSVQEIDQHIEEQEKLVSASKELNATINVCATYKVVRPVLVFAKSILSFIKPKWAEVLGTFIATVDALCVTPV